MDYGGGQAWAQVVLNVKNYVANQGWSTQVIVGGGNDMEPDWETASNTVNWVNGYSSVTSTFMINFGSADGCPQYSYGNGVCNNGWTQHDLWWISRGAAPTRSMPQINYQSMARQWAMISRYGYTYQSARKIFFEGPMDNNYLASGMNTSQQAWDQLRYEINKSSSTSGDLTYSVQIHYSS